MDDGKWDDDDNDCALARLMDEASMDATLEFRRWYRRRLLAGDSLRTTFSP